MNDSNIEIVEKMISEKGLGNHGIISIDGPCGSGKTTLATELNEKYSYNVVHMDDFYLPFQKRDKNWMNIVAGHMDFKRLIETVLLPYKNRQKTNYVSYDCHSDKYLKSIPIDLDKIIMLEGSYSSHPELSDYIDVKIFMDIDSKEQISRLTKRNPKTVDKFISMWIPFENRYFEESSIRKESDKVLNKCFGI